MKLVTFDASNTKAKLSASMGGDHINLTPKLRPVDGRNGNWDSNIYSWFVLPSAFCIWIYVDSDVNYIYAHIQSTTQSCY